MHHFFKKSPKKPTERHSFSRTNPNGIGSRGKKKTNKMITEFPCPAHFAGDRDNIVTTDAKRFGLGIALWQKQNDQKVRPIAFASPYLNHAGRNYSIRNLEKLVVV